MTHWLGQGKESGLAIGLHTADVVAFAHRKIIRTTTGYADKADALKAVGLSE